MVEVRRAADGDQALVNDAPAGHRPAGFDPSRFVQELIRRRERARKADSDNFVAPIIDCVLSEVIDAAKAAAPPSDSPALKALRLALPIIEADYALAQDYRDADWAGICRTALVAARDALGLSRDSDGSGGAGQTAEQAGPEATARAEGIAQGGQP